MRDRMAGLPAFGRAGLPIHALRARIAQARGYFERLESRPGAVFKPAAVQLPRIEHDGGRAP